MPAQEVLDLVDRAFGNVPVPDSFTLHPGCEECEALDDALAVDPQSLPDGIAWQLPLLTPEAFRYLMPLFVYAAIEGTDDDLTYNFLQSLAQPISIADPPDRLLQTKCFDRAQTAATLAFIEFVRDLRYANSDGRPQWIDRAVCNWRHFLSRFDPHSRPDGG